MSHPEGDRDRQALIDRQRANWEQTFASNPGIYGPLPSAPGIYAVERFVAEGISRVLELGPGPGRDTVALLDAGIQVTALDYAAGPLAGIATAAGPELALKLTTMVHDVRQPLPLPSASFDASYSHMLFTMALSSEELVALAREVHRVLRLGGLCVYTVRHVGDPHCGGGRALGDNLYENGGFVVHFFDPVLVERLASGFEIEDWTEFEEGDLPRRLWRITMRRSDTSAPAL